MGLIRTWFRQLHLVELLVDFPAPVMRKRSALDSHDWGRISRIINLSGYSLAWRALEARSGQMSDTKLATFCPSAGCRALVCRIYWAVPTTWASTFYELSWECEWQWRYYNSKSGIYNLELTKYVDGQIYVLNSFCVKCILVSLREQCKKINSANNDNAK